MKIFASNLVDGYKWLYGGYWPKIQFSVKFNMATAAILQIYKQVYLGQLLTDLHQIWCTGSFSHTRVTGGPQ